MGKGRRKAVHLLVSAQSISSDGGLAKNVLIGVVFILIFRLVRLATEVIASNSSTAAAATATTTAATTPDATTARGTERRQTEGKCGNSVSLVSLGSLVSLVNEVSESLELRIERVEGCVGT